MTNENINNKVRLTTKQLEDIIAAFKDNFPITDKLWIFGSRADLNAKGGDIDLYIETMLPDANDVIDRKFKMISNIWRNIGEQKIDVVLNMIQTKHELEIYKQAKQNGIQLV